MGLDKTFGTRKNNKRQIRQIILKEDLKTIYLTYHIRLRELCHLAISGQEIGGFQLHLQ